MKKTIKRTVSAVVYSILIIVLCIAIIQKISNNNLSFFGYRIFRVVSESMIPEYNINDILLIKNVNTKEIKIGDNISYLNQVDTDLDVIITHKVVNIEKDSEGKLLFHTKGIANTIEDPIVKEEQVYGVVTKKMHLLSLMMKLLNNAYGFILVVFIPLILIICSNIKELIIMIKEKNDEK